MNLGMCKAGHTINSVCSWSREEFVPDPFMDYDCEKDSWLSKKSVSVKCQFVVSPLNSRSGHYSIPEEP